MSFVSAGVQQDGKDKAKIVPKDEEDEDDDEGRELRPVFANSRFVMGNATCVMLCSHFYNHLNFSSNLIPQIYIKHSFLLFR